MELKAQIDEMKKAEERAISMWYYIKVLMVILSVVVILSYSLP